MAQVGVASTITVRENIDDDQKSDLLRALDARFENVVLINPKRCWYILRNNTRPEVYHGTDRITGLSAFIAFSTLGRERSTGFLVQCLSEHDVVIADGDRYMREDSSKLFTTLDRIRRNISPATYVAFSRVGAKRMGRAVQYPVVVKPVDGRRGEGVVKVDSYQQLEPIIERFFADRTDDDLPFFMQQFVPIKYEYRVMMLNGHAIGIARKNKRDNPDNAEGFQHMVQWGGGMFCQTAHRRPVAVAETHCHQEGLIGVDIVWSRDDHYYVIEENRAPGGWVEFERVTGVNVADAYAEMLAEVLQLQPDRAGPRIENAFDEEEEDAGPPRIGA